MTKDQFGINISAIAIIAFILTGLNLGGLVTVVLITGFAVIVEKNGWLNKQVLQALYLGIGYQIIMLVFGWLFSFIYWVMGNQTYYASVGYGVVSLIQQIINIIMAIGLILFALLAISRVAHERDAHLPIVGNLADYTLGKPRPPKPVYQPVYQQPYQQGAPVYQQPGAPAYHQPGAPVYQQPAAPVYHQPAAPAAPVYQQPVAPVAPVEPAAPAAKTTKAAKAAEATAAAPAAAPVQAASAEWNCSCGRQNSGKFCMACGKPRP